MNPAAKKRFGQHFLRDTGMIERIVTLIEPCSADSFVEIGPGDGALTRRLAPRVNSLVAIEVDRDRIHGLVEEMSPFAHVRIVEGDILSFDLDELPALFPAGEGTLRAAGNLPYNIATAIIERFLQSKLKFRDMTFMVQREVAERIVARPGTRQYGYLSVYCQYKASVALKFKVPPACFSPRPKVLSAILILHPRIRTEEPEVERAFIDVVKAAFSHRRKTILNSLEKNAMFEPIAVDLLEKAGIKATRRAEELSVEEYLELAKQLSLFHARG